MTNLASHRVTCRIANSAVAVLAVASAALTACGSNDTAEPEATMTPSSDLAPTETTNPDPQPSNEASLETSIRIVVGDETLDATLLDNPAARSLLDQLPLTLDFSDYGGQEVLAEPPEPLTMDGMPDGESAPTGTIGYYQPDGVVVLYYTDVPRFTGIVRLGTIDGDVSILRGWNDSRPVTIERAA